MDTVVRSWEELRAAAPAILERLDGDPRASVAALADPVGVLARLGWVVEGDDRREIVDRLRLGPAPAARLAALRAELAEATGHDVEPQDPKDVRRLLDELELPAPSSGSPTGPVTYDAPETQATRTTPAPVRVPPRAWTPDGPGPEPLDAWPAHPVLDLVREYRRLDAARPPFAPPHVLDAVLSGRATPAVTAAHARFQATSRRTSRTRTAPTDG